jgi:hypothetical protein
VKAAQHLADDAPGCCVLVQVMAGLAAQAKAAGWRTLLVSTDKDLWQVGAGHGRQQQAEGMLSMIAAVTIVL